MSLEALKARNREATSFDWNGLKINLRKIGAKDGISLFNTIGKKKEAVDAGSDDHLETVRFHALLASKSLCDERGELIADSDEDRAELENTAFDALVELGELVMKHSGMSAAEAKKN